MRRAPPVTSRAIRLIFSSLPTHSTRVAAPGYAEAKLIIECQKIYWQDMAPSHFLAPDIEKNYPHKHYHRIYFGEIVAVLGEDAYRATE